jgi:hypothetical protein
MGLCAQKESVIPPKLTKNLPSPFAVAGLLVVRARKHARWPRGRNLRGAQLKGVSLFFFSSLFAFVGLWESLHPPPASQAFCTRPPGREQLTTTTNAASPDKIELPTKKMIRDLVQNYVIDTTYWTGPNPTWNQAYATRVLAVVALGTIYAFLFKVLYFVCEAISYRVFRKYKSLNAMQKVDWTSRYSYVNIPPPPCASSISTSYLEISQPIDEI